MKILITGDFNPNGRNLQFVGDGNYNAVFNDTIMHIKNVDLAITNLEVPLTETNLSIKKTGPALKALPLSIRAITQAGFKLVTLANNHIMDYGVSGLIDTLRVCSLNNVDVVGAGLNNEQARQPFVYSKEEKTLAILAIAENEWSTTTDDNPGASPLDTLDIYYDIQKAKAIADFVLLIVHGGHETYALPSPRMKKLYRFFVDIGANAVVGHHTHCISGYEIYNQAPIVYGLGNFLFDKPSSTEEWRQGLMAQLDFGNRVKLTLYPIIQNENTAGVRLVHEDQKDQIFHYIDKLNQIIGDDKELNSRFEDFCAKHEGQYIQYIQPYANVYLYRLSRLALFPKNVWSKKKLRYLRNMLSCESHRDVLSKVLNIKNN